MLDATTAFIVDLFILLAAAVLAGEIAVQLGQAALVGQLLVGVALGPTLLGPFLGLNQLPAGLGALQTLAVIFVLFLAGLDIVPEQVYGMGLGNLGLGLAVFLVPFTVGSFVVGPVVGIPYPTSLYVALALSITALPVMGILLAEFRLTHTKIGQLLLNAALINEFAAVSVFAVLLRLGGSTSQGAVGIAIAGLSLALFVSAMLSIHQGLKLLREARLWSGLTRAFQKTWRSKQGNFALLMVLVVGATLFSQFLGLTYVVGAFYAGLLVTRESAGREAHHSISQVFDAMSWGFFIPLFFAFVGISMNLRLLDTAASVAAFGVLLVVAAVTKIVTGAAGARLLGWKPADALAIGHFVNSRGAVELAMAVILLQSGLIDIRIFTLIAGVGLVTTILSPIGAIRSWLSDPESRDALYRRIPTMRPGPSHRRMRFEPPGLLDWAKVDAEWPADPHAPEPSTTLIRPIEPTPTPQPIDEPSSQASGAAGSPPTPPLPKRSKPPT
ncbi:MAG TPA: cation:proton antiporter [Thermoplasmata archaeon]|nr:cation:proton antiporter [Thermoplasmata archaeon]